MSVTQGSFKITSEDSVREIESAKPSSPSIRNRVKVKFTKKKGRKQRSGGKISPSKENVIKKHVPEPLADFMVREEPNEKEIDLRKYIAKKQERQL